MPLQCRYPEPDEFKVDATHTCWVSCTKAGIHSKYAERIRRYKYRQGYRPAGEHPRDSFSINHIRHVANLSCARTVNFTLDCMNFLHTFVFIQKTLQLLPRWSSTIVHNVNIAEVIYSWSARLALTLMRP